MGTLAPRSVGAPSISTALREKPRLQRDKAGEGGRSDAGQRADALRHLLVEGAAATAVIALQTDVERNRDHMAGLKTRFDLLVVL
jgi:hypothetical protein